MDENLCVELLTLLDCAINKIKNDINSNSDFLEKYSKASNQLDKLKILLLLYNSEEIDLFLKQISSITEDIPKNFEQFFSWLSVYIKNKNQDYISIKQNISALHQHLNDFFNYISSMSKSNFSDNLIEFQEKENEIIKDLNLLKAENNENNSNYHINTINDLTNQIYSLKIKLNQMENNSLMQMKQIDLVKQQLIDEQKLNDHLCVQINSFSNENEKLEIENAKINKLLKQNEISISNYKKRIFILNRKLKQNQVQISQLLTERAQVENSKDADEEIKSLKNKNEFYKNQIVEINKSLKIDSNFDGQTHQIIEKFDKLNKENSKLKNNQKILMKNIMKLKSCLIKIKAENQKLKSEIQSIHNLTSSSIFETINRLTTENNELKKSLFSANDKTGNLNDDSVKQKSNSKSSLYPNEPSKNSQQLSKEEDKFNENPQNLEEDKCNEASSLNHSFMSDDANNQYKSAISGKDKKITCLQSRIFTLEEEKLKLINEIKKFRNNSDKNNMDLKKLGFLLADALCQRYNPSRFNFEIKRLIEVARTEHIKLSESVRVPLDPFESRRNVPETISDEIKKKIVIL